MPRHVPRAAAVRSTANVWPVTGTGVNGRGMDTWAARPTKAAPPITRIALRTALRGKASARTPGAGVARAMAVSWSVLVERRDGPARAGMSLAGVAAGYG